MMIAVTKLLYDELQCDKLLLLSRTRPTAAFNVSTLKQDRSINRLSTDNSHDPMVALETLRHLQLPSPRPETSDSRHRIANREHSS